MGPRVDQTSGAPNVVLVVIDCATFSDLLAPDRLARLPCIADLLDQGLTCHRAVSVAPWTLPSHVSMLSGLYPWEHGVHRRSSIQLSPKIVTLPRLLRRAGYRSLALSGNPIVSDVTGITRDFDSAAWAGTWEKWLRFIPHRRPARRRAVAYAGSSAESPLGEEELLNPALRPVSRLLNRAGFAADAPLELIRLLGISVDDDAIAASPWITSAFESWVRAAPPEVPLLALINFFDAHEPYIPDHRVRMSLRSWLRYARIAQDNYSWSSGSWSPSPEEFEALRGFYQRSLERIDRQLATICGQLRAQDRWTNTLLVVTADHGQAFGESGMLFHPSVVADSLLHVPLIVKYPRSDHAGRQIRSWVSLVDLLPTILRACGEPAPPGLPGQPLEDGDGGRRPAPVLSFSDGGADHGLAPSHRPTSPRAGDLALLGFDGDQRYRLDLVSRVLTVAPWTFVRPSPPAADVSTGDRGVEETLRAIGRTILPGVQDTSGARMVEKRLQSWGYG